MTVAGTALALLRVRISLTRRHPMTTQISTKLAALAVALMMNSLLIGGVAYVFSLESTTTTVECAALPPHVVV
jgi:hypothetical protein